MKSVTVGQITANFSRIQLSIGLEIEHLSLEATDACAELKPFRLSVPRSGILKAAITYDAIAAFLELNAPAGLRKFKVSREDESRLAIEAVAKILVDVKAKAIVRLIIEEEKRVVVELESADVLGGPVKKLVETQLEKINPIFDAADLPFPVWLDSCQLMASGVEIHGRAEP